MSGFDDPRVAKIIEEARLACALNPLRRWDAARQAIQVECATTASWIGPARSTTCSTTRDPSTCRSRSRLWSVLGPDDRSELRIDN